MDHPWQCTIHFVLMLALLNNVRSAYSSTPTWLTDPSPGNRPRPTAQGRALQECPCRARPRCFCNDTSSGSTRPLCRAPFRCRESVSQFGHDVESWQQAFPRWFLFLGRFKCSCSISQTSEHTLPRQLSPGEMAAFCQVMLVNCRHPTQTFSSLCIVNLTSSLGTRIWRPWPRRIDLHKTCEQAEEHVRDIGGSRGVLSRTPRVQHALDNRAHHGSLTQHDKLEAVAGNERHVLAGRSEIHGEICTKARREREGIKKGESTCGGKKRKKSFILQISTRRARVYPGWTSSEFSRAANARTNLGAGTTRPSHSPMSVTSVHRHPLPGQLFTQPFGLRFPSPVCTSCSNKSCPTNCLVARSEQQ